MTETTGDSSEQDNDPCPCGNETAPTEEICTDCLDALRERDREANYTDYVEHINGSDTPW